jgi:hypothetical protein
LNPYEEDIAKDALVFNVKSQKPVESDDEEAVEELGKSTAGTGAVEYVRKRRKLTDAHLHELMQKFTSVVVHDYGDEYHLSEEERASQNKFYEAFANARRCKHKYRKIDEFIRAYRTKMECLRIVAENNGVYDKDKFMKRVLTGKIHVTGLEFPKYTGKDRKTIGWDYVTEYILDPTKDPRELVETENVYEDLDSEELEKQLFSEDELRALEQSIEYDQEHPPIDAYYDPDIPDEAPETAVFEASEKEMKKLIQEVPMIPRILKDIVTAERNKRARDRKLNRLVFEMTEDDFAEIEKEDAKFKFKSETDVPEFKGDLTSDKDYRRYMYALEEYENTQIKKNYRGKMRTQEEIDYMELIDAFEKDGWNVRSLYNMKEDEKKAKKIAKRDRKEEERLKARLLKLDERAKARKGGIEVNSKKSKKKEKKSKKKKESD